MSQFNYKQRKTTDSYRKGWEKVFSDPDPMECDCLFWAGIWDKEELKREKKHHPRCKYAETTEQKQPLVTAKE